MGCAPTRNRERRVIQDLVGILCVAFALAPSPATASGTEPSSYALSIRSQPLDDALQELARQSGIRIVYLSRVTDGLKAGALEGEYTAGAALKALLAGSKLTFRMLNENTIEIRRAKRRNALAARGNIEKQLRGSVRKPDPMEEVIVTAMAEGVVATRVETPLREIPQTISVITLTQMRTQNLTRVGEAMDRVPGVTTTHATSLEKDFLVRGFPVTSFHVDGSANLDSLKTNGQWVARPDLAEFERIEVLRGSDGLFSGNGEPGASINLVRKRPLAERAVEIGVSWGSWNTRRVEIDATGSPAFDGSLRGRIVGVLADRNFFYDTATHERQKIFAVLEYDVTPDTLLTLGGSYQHDDSIPVAYGFGLDNELTDPHRPRDIGWTFDWSYHRMQVLETYLQLQQRFGDDWKLRFGAASWNGSLEYGLGSFNSRLDPTTQAAFFAGVFATFTTQPNDRDQFAADMTLTGTLDLFGFSTQVALGGEYASRKSIWATQGYDMPGVFVSLNDYDASFYPDPRLTQSTNGSPLVSLRKSESSGAFASLKAHLGDAWSVSVGGRIGQDSYSGAFWDGTRFNDTPSARQAPQRVVTPYAALTFDIGEHYSLYASYADIYRRGSDFRRPDGSKLGTVHGVNLEAGIKAAWRDGAVNAALAGYKVQQFRVPVQLPQRFSKSYTAYLPGINESVGADLELSGTPAPGWLLGVGYTFNENRLATAILDGVRGNLGDVRRLSTRTPKHLLKAWTSKQLSGSLDRWIVGGNLHAQTQQSWAVSPCIDIRPSGACWANSRAMREGAAYAVLDLSASYAIDANWRVGLTVKNIFDKIYYETLGALTSDNWYGEPRNFLVKIDASF